MTDPIPLDAAHTAMIDNPADDAARLRFYERVADVELYLLLEDEPDGDQISPALLDESYVLVFDRIERLAAYVGDTAPYVALSGRAIAGMLENQPLGIAINVGVAPSAILLPADAVAWLRDTLSHEAGEVEARIERVLPPTGLPETLISATVSRSSELAPRSATTVPPSRISMLRGVSISPKATVRRGA